MLPSMPGPYTRFRDDRVRGVASPLAPNAAGAADAWSSRCCAT